MNIAEETALFQSLLHFFMWRSSTEALHEQQIKQILEHQKQQLQRGSAGCSASIQPTTNNVAATSNKEDELKQVAANNNATTTENPSSTQQKPPPLATATAQKTNEKQSLEKKQAVAEDATPPNTAAAKMPSSAPTPAAAQSPPPTRTATPSDLPPLSVRYSNVLEALLQQFPHLVRPPPTVVSFPPAIATSFSLYPSMSRQVMTLTARVHELENRLKIRAASDRRPTKNNIGKKSTPQNKKRDRQDEEDGPAAAAAAATGDTTGASPSSKKRKSRRKEGPISIMAPIKHRTDVPDDIKEFIDKLRSERRTTKQRLHRLENRANKQKEELEKKQSAAPVEASSVASRPAQAVDTAKAPPAAATTTTATNPSLSHEETVSAVLRQYVKSMTPPPTWEERIKELEHFKLGNAHCRVPLRVPGLGRWVGEIRSLYRKSLEDPLWLVSQEPKEGEVLGQYALTKDRIDQLNAMGFEWNLGKPNKSLEERIEQLKNFKEKNGHARVPRSYRDDPSLGEWVHMQRKLRRTKKMKQDRIEKLDAVGFVWDCHDVVKMTWDERIEQCRAFRRKNGHLKVPTFSSITEEVSKDEKSFLLWASRQRQEYRKFISGMQAMIDKVRIKQLEQMGFDFTNENGELPQKRTHHGAMKNEELYDSQLEKLRQVKDHFGSCNDNNQIKAMFPGDTSLMYWIKAQRKHYKNKLLGKWSALSPERLNKLNALGFEFEPRKHYAPYGSKKAADRLAATAAKAENEEEDEEEEENNQVSAVQFGFL